MTDEGCEPTAPSADLVGDDAAYLQSLRAGMPERSRSVMARLDRVNSVYVVTYRDRVLSEAFDTFMEDVLATREGRRREADVFFVTGESGAGKSMAIARLLRGHPAMQPRRGSFGTVSPYVSVKLTGYMLPRIAAAQIMEAAGHPVSRKTRQGDAWNEMPSVLRKRRVILVHVDEVQHLVGRSGTANDYRKLADAIKGISISEPWPVAFMLSGLPRATKLAVADEQFERRGRWVHFADVNVDEHRRLVVRVMEKFSKAADLGLGTLPDADMPERIAHAANYRFGRICQIVGAAVHQALRDEKAPADLLRGHFAMAYANRSRARGNNEMNPFLVEDWKVLKAGSYLVDKPRFHEEGGE